MSGEHPDAKIDLEVKNFGPLAHAHIDLRPLTVFVGPSNTGKTYLATLIYALHQFVARLRDAEHSYHRLAGEKLNEADVEAVEEWFEQFTMNPASSGDADQTLREIPPKIEKMVKDRLASGIRLDELLSSIVARSFGVGEDFSSLARATIDTHAPASVDLTVDQARPKSSLNLHTNLRNNEALASSQLLISGDINLRSEAESIILGRGISRYRLPLLRLLSDTAGGGELYARMAIADFVGKVLAQNFGHLGQYAYHLPAARTGIMHAHATVVSALVRQASYGGLRRQSDMPLLSGVVTDFLEELIDIGRHPSHPMRDCAALAKGLEADVLAGSIDLDRSDIDYPAFTYSPQDMDQQLPLIRSSSMVSELAPIVLYLRHLVDRGDTLILEEPESHLHPAAQMKLTEHLARLVNHGVRVILTTHSNWIVDQISNLVKRDELCRVASNDVSGCDAALSEADVGVWSFAVKEINQGSVVSEVQFDREGVGYDVGYLVKAEEQYNEWAKLHNRLADRSQ